MAQSLHTWVAAMKPWFLLLVIGALSGIVVLRTAYAESDDSNPRPRRVTATNHSAGEY